MKNLIIIFALLMFGNVQAQQWFQIPVNTDKQLLSIDFPTNDVGYIGGKDSLLLKTIDGGQTWTEMSPSGFSFSSGAAEILNLRFFTEQIGYANIGPYGGLYKTIDGGLTWQGEPTNNAGLCYQYTSFFFNENNGFVGGSGCFTGEIIDKLDNGIWQSTTMVESWHSNYHVSSIDFYNSNYGLAGSTQSYIYKTTDGGLNWDTIPSSLDTIPISDVLIVNDTLAYATYYDEGFGVLVSHDAGDSWDINWNAATFWYPDLYTLYEAGNGFVYAGGRPGGFEAGVILEKTINQYWYGTTLDQTINDINGYGDSVVFAVGDSGYVVTNVDPAMLSINEFEQSINAKVFPNPFNNIINVELESNSNTELSLYDISGKLVLNKILSKRESILDLEKLKAGFYLLYLRNEEGSYQQKLIKQ